MVVVTTAQHHRNRAAQFRSHAEHATLAETREMYLRLARTEAAMAELAERRHQSEMIAHGQLTLPVPQDPKKSRTERAEAAGAHCLSLNYAAAKDAADKALRSPEKG
jgi:hypothetical protein